MFRGDDKSCRCCCLRMSHDSTEGYAYFVIVMFLTVTTLPCFHPVCVGEGDGEITEATLSSSSLQKCFFEPKHVLEKCI